MGVISELRYWKEHRNRNCNALKTRDEESRISRERVAMNYNKCVWGGGKIDRLSKRELYLSKRLSKLGGRREGSKRWKTIVVNSRSSSRMAGRGRVSKRTDVPTFVLKLPGSYATGRLASW